MEFKLPLPLKSVASLHCEKQISTVQLYSTVNSVKSDEKRLIAENLHEECYFFVFLHSLISVMCLKCLPSAIMF